VAGCLRAGARRGTDLAARYGGEEFSLVLVDADLATASRLAEAVREAVAALAIPHEDSPHGRVTVSIGVAVMHADSACRSEDLVRAADGALYSAKQNGRNRIEVDPESARTSDLPPALLQLIWHAAYESGHAQIDDQHRVLFGLANRLLASITSGSAAEVVADHADALLACAAEHFRDEEALLAEHKYPGLAEHAAIHKRLLDRATELAACCRAGRCETGEMFEYLAQELVAKHILGNDRELAAVLSE
jgi:hemerythrin-like metal-binding protein